MSDLAIFGGERTRVEPLPAWPDHDERDVDAVAAVVRSGNWGGSRTRVRKLNDSSTPFWRCKTAALP